MEGGRTGSSIGRRVSIKLLIDMNLSPDWVPVLTRGGWPAVHWSTVGDPRASDRTIMDWAAKQGYVLFAHDLDFGTHAGSCPMRPVQAWFRFAPMTCRRVISEVWSSPFLDQHEADLASGSLVVVDESRSRVRILPI